ncbi:hypothetical protein DFJ74DRAFT_767365 [Hyaloraphidium curvatum]|nr:hypothetical protein DFJ74DRAFT_767365 [Hyaloraphidium curvatum]
MEDDGPMEGGSASAEMVVTAAAAVPRGRGGRRARGRKALPAGGEDEVAAYGELQHGAPLAAIEPVQVNHGHVQELEPEPEQELEQERVQERAEEQAQPPPAQPPAAPAQPPLFLLPFPAPTLRPLAGKFAAVIGGSSGIGRASCLRLAAAGATVLLSYRTGLDRARALLASMPPPPAGQPPHEIFPLELADDASILAAALAISAACAGRGLHVLVLTAAATHPALPSQNLPESPSSVLSLLHTNVVGPYSCIRALLPLLRQAGGDAVVVPVTSIAGETGKGPGVAYAASKGALDSMVLGLGRLLAPEVRVVSVAPGTVDTPFVPDRSPADLHLAASRTPLRRVLQPDEVADAVMAAVALRAATGTRIVVDGGLRLVV